MGNVTFEVEKRYLTFYSPPRELTGFGMRNIMRLAIETYIPVQVTAKRRIKVMSEVF